MDDSNISPLVGYFTFTFLGRARYVFCHVPTFTPNCIYREVTFAQWSTWTNGQYIVVHHGSTNSPRGSVSMLSAELRGTGFEERSISMIIICTECYVWRKESRNTELKIVQSGEQLFSLYMIILLTNEWNVYSSKIIRKLDQYDDDHQRRKLAVFHMTVWLRSLHGKDDD